MTGRRIPGGAGGAVLATVAVLAAACAGSSPSSPRTPPASAGARPAEFKLGSYQPLWPFASAGDVADWQRGYRAGGHQPWRLSPDETALAFARYLGVGGIDRVTRRTVAGGDARIGVGYRSAEGAGTAAVVHLLRVGTGSDAPWEVVGADGTELTLTAPAYGAAVSSPISVGGLVTGVDESIKVEVRERSSAEPLGTFCCRAAGGERSPWSAKVPFRGATDSVLTVVVATGGHVAEVERFSVTAVRVAQ